MYNMNTLTREELIKMIKNGDDSHNNQIWVRENGDVFLSETTGTVDIYGLKFRFEAFDAGDSYVGPDAATDESHINKLYKDLQYAWESGRTGCVDDWGAVPPRK